MKASFEIKNENEKIRLMGEVVKRNPKTTLIVATLPEDFGGKEMMTKRHNVKHNVLFEGDPGFDENIYVARVGEQEEGDGKKAEEVGAEEEIVGEDVPVEETASVGETLPVEGTVPVENEIPSQEV